MDEKITNRPVILVLLSFILIAVFLGALCFACFIGFELHYGTVMCSDAEHFHLPRSSCTK